MGDADSAGSPADRPFPGAPTFPSVRLIRLDPVLVLGVRWSLVIGSWGAGSDLQQPRQDQPKSPSGSNPFRAIGPRFDSAVRPPGGGGHTGTWSFVGASRRSMQKGQKEICRIVHEARAGLALVRAHSN